MLPMDLAALAVSCCHTWGLFYESLNNSSPRDYLSGTLFLKAFVDPSTPFAPSRHLSVRWANVDADTVPVELAMHYHLRHLGALVAATEWEEDEETPIDVDDAPLGIICRREWIRLNRTRSFSHEFGRRKWVDVQMFGCLSSISLTIRNSPDGSFNVVVLADNGNELVAMDPHLASGALDTSGDGLFPGGFTQAAKGLEAAGRCTGLTQFLLTMLVVFRRWEESWTRTLHAFDKAASFQWDNTSDESALDALMFDESFQLSKTYFRALQTLRLGSNMVDDALQDWTSLRHEWETVVHPSGMFSGEDLDAATKNWDMASELIEARIHRVQARISRKIEDVKSLRDGLFNATSLREASKTMTLNRAIYVFTVVTVLYTPLAFVAGFWALPVFYKDNNNNSSSSSNGSSSSSNTGSTSSGTIATNTSKDEGERPPLPSGFIATFVLVPLLTYCICLAVVWIFGLNDNERKAAVAWVKRQWERTRRRGPYLMGRVFLWWWWRR
ncbi:hypothetical protein C8A05DRAFT_13229 [Staphylotrichum tortipilum]|uniref:Uncharacterized protein n=1 Tax=Staphylotrichum tortipilum TaxID=2831512 RepID=A0AAN6RW31_9PEZI|nr:hypothetical protein C8A05DRAFT_13229 [Staphylotrichum longicolle]